MTLEELRNNFNHFDTDSDGKISLVEFQQLLAALDALEPGEEAEIGFRAIDTDNSGIVEFDEFVAWFSDR